MICDLRIIPNGYNHHQNETDLNYIDLSAVARVWIQT